MIETQSFPESAEDEDTFQIIHSKRRVTCIYQVEPDYCIVAVSRRISWFNALDGQDSFQFTLTYLILPGLHVTSTYTTERRFERILKST